jgi:hypothetical protein
MGDTGDDTRPLYSVQYPSDTRTIVGRSLLSAHTMNVSVFKVFGRESDCMDAVTGS